MNTNEFMNGIFPTTAQTKFNIQDDKNNKIINEAIILDKLGNNKEFLLEFYNNIGKFGARDGVLNENAVTDIKLQSFDSSTNGEVASLLAVAKEANDVDYDLYIKAIMLMQKCIENMKSRYGNIAKDRFESQTAVVESNPRIQDAIEKTQESCSSCK